MEELGILWPQKKTGIACTADGSVMEVQGNSIQCPKCGRTHE